MRGYLERNGYLTLIAYDARQQTFTRESVPHPFSAPAPVEKAGGPGAANDPPLLACPAAAAPADAAITLASRPPRKSRFRRRSPTGNAGHVPTRRRP